MTQGRSKLWWAFWGGVLLIVAALSWASFTVYTLEARSAVSRAMNQRQELIRLALWRMDSRLAPMIALEAARPIEDYETVLDSFASSDRRERSSDMLSRAKKAVSPGDFARGYFEINELGATKGSGSEADEIAVLTQTQQQILDDGLLKQKTENELASSILEATEELADSNAGGMSSPSSLNASPQRVADFEARQEIANIAQNSQALSTSQAKEDQDEITLEQADKKSADLPPADSMAYRDLSDAVVINENAAGLSSGLEYRFAAEHLGDVELLKSQNAPATETVVSTIEPRWVLRGDGSHELVLTRTIERGGEPVVQGVWLDWATMSTELLGSIDDLLPTSTLTPIIGDYAQPLFSKNGQQLPSYQLATVPVSFNPGGAIDVAGDRLTPAMMAMLVTWIAVILAMIAVGMVLRTVLNLSARRGRFVGAVTHELRTPLTTFRLYSQMLADGMVTDESVRKEYLNTLKRESDRLTGIVENVLEYARISRQRYGKDKPKGEQRLSVGELMARIVPPMSRLGEQAGMDLVVSDETGDHAERTVTLDPHAVERIVMNLMDNACKYAGGESEGGESDLRVHLDASVEGGALRMVVSDHGPGVPSRDRRKIFGEFVRGSSSALRDRSGLGLGLALSRGLAIELGGDLELVRHRGHGAEFELRIPLDDKGIS